MLCPSQVKLPLVKTYDGRAGWLTCHKYTVGHKNVSVDIRSYVYKC